MTNLLCVSCHNANDTRFASKSITLISKKREIDIDCESKLNKNHYRLIEMIRKRRI